MTDRKIKVLHIITNLPIGGAQDNTLLTVEHLDRSKYDVTLICAKDGDWVVRANEISHLRIFYLDDLVRRIHPLKDILALLKLFKNIRKEKYDIVHTHSSKPGFSGRIAAKLAGTPIIIHTIHGFPFNDFMHPVLRRTFILLERFLSKLSDKLITVSNLNLRKAVELKFDKSHKFINIYSGIDFSKFNSSIDIPQQKQDLELRPQDKIVGMVGRLSEQKAPLDFIRAIPDVLKIYKDTMFLLVGDGELRQNIESLIETLQINSRVKILGFRDDIARLLQVFDIYVLTSHWEGLGRSLTEAMYMGKPAVATRVEGVPELVEHGKTGLLVSPKDIKGISDGIIKILSDQKLAVKLGKAARQKVAEHFEAKVMVEKIDRLYQQLLKKRNIL